MVLTTDSRIFSFCKCRRWTSRGITADSNGEDYSWDAVWKSKAVITDFGWVVEMRIPYAAPFFK
jgi:hypothetical protein